MLGFTEEQFAGFDLTIGVEAFMLYMLFVITQMAWASKAGKFGTFCSSWAWLLGYLALSPRGSFNACWAIDIFWGKSCE